MKYWLSHLPLEVWVDVYRHPWIERNQLGPIVDRFGNRKFAEYLQFYLHDWGRRTLERLIFNFPEERVCRRKHKHRAGCVRPMTVPRTPVPANIKSFGLIYIGNFDQHTIDFLRQLQPLLVDINLDIQHIGLHVHTPANVRTILANLVPLITGIHSLCCSVLALPMVGQLFGGEKLDKLKVLTIRYGDGAVLPKPKEQQPATIQLIMEWLTQQQQPADGGIGARWCYIGLNGFFEQIFAAIRQDFLAAKEPRTFVVSVRHYDDDEFAEFHLENGCGEELHGVRQIVNVVQITRHRANCAKQLEEWIEENEAKRSSDRSKIYVQSPTIGPIDAPEDKAEDQRPSTSRKA